MDRRVTLSEARAAYYERLVGGPPWDEETEQLRDVYCAAVEAEAKRLGAMRLDHPRWPVFYRHLGDAVAEHGCQAGKNKAQAERVLAMMGEPMLAEWFDAHGGFCDCEILMNIDSLEFAVDDDVRQRALAEIDDE